MFRIAQRNARPGARIVLTLVAVASLFGCHQDMWNQPRVAALQRAEFYPDTMGSRGPVPGTVRYEGIRRRWTAPVFDGLTGERNVPLLTDTTFWTGKTPEGFLPDNYFTLTRALLERGRDRFEVSCMPCHGLVGDGRGVVAQRGFPNPASYHTDRLREVEDGYIFDVVTNGFGRMYSYASRVAPEDRWAIAAYIRALQTSQNLDVTDRNSTLAQLVVGGLKEQEQAKAQAAPATHGEAAHEETAHGEAEVNHAQ